MVNSKDQNVVFDIHADEYSKKINKTLNKYGADHDFFTAHKAGLLLEILATHSKDPADMTLMDVGCGVGKVHAHLKQSFKSILGIDLSEPSIDVARALHPEVHYECYGGDVLPAADNSVDMTLAICVFHHVPVQQWQAFSAEMMRVLRPGGLAVVIEHNPLNPLTRHIVNTCPLDADAVLLQPRKLRGLFQSVGAEAVTSRTVLSVPPKASFLKKIDNYLGVLPFGAQYYTLAHKPLMAAV